MSCQMWLYGQRRRDENENQTRAYQYYISIVENLRKNQLLPSDIKRQRVQEPDFCLMVVESTEQLEKILQSKDGNINTEKK